MKSNLAAILLVVACLGLGAVVWWQYQSHTDQTQNLGKALNSYSNRVSTLEDMLAHESSDKANLSNDMVAVGLKLSNDLAVAHTTLSTTSKDLDKAQADAKASAAAVAAAAAALAEKENRIKELEGQKTDWDKESSDLHLSISNLEIQIQAAQKKLDAAVGDRELLVAELKVLRAQKEELERRLSDLASLREQVRTLKENLSIARRLQFIQQGFYDLISQKGGGRMVNPPLPPGPPGAATNKSLDVEFHQTGDVKINSPAATNAPATNTPAVRAPSSSAPPAR